MGDRKDNSKQYSGFLYPLHFKIQRNRVSAAYSKRMRAFDFIPFIQSSTHGLVS